MLWEFEGATFATRSEMCAARRARYVEHLEEGMNFTQAAHAVGVSKRTGKVWRNGRTRSSGRNEAPSVDWYRGDMPLPKKVDSRYLSEEERIEIADGLLAGESMRSIAGRLGRPASTVSREVARNCGPDGRYRPHRAQQLAAARLARPKRRKVADNPELLALVDEKLRLHWSPEQISGWLRLEYPGREEMNVCAETIYQAIYVQAKGQLRKDVASRLRTGRAQRAARGSGQERRPRFRDPMVMVSERPAEAEDRAVPGHWEGDLILGAGNASAVGTLVERATRFTLLLHLPDGHGADAVQDAIVRKMRSLPEAMRASLTWDQGSELARHARISAELDMGVYFCDPHSPWQRGTNENTNGLLRQYFPKGTDLSVYPEAYLDFVAAELNGRPRKTLGFRTPAEVFAQLVGEEAA